MQPGSVAGYRAREKFEELPSPNIAVARTERVGGWLVVSSDGGGDTLASACVAVELTTLRSIDQLPGFNTADRDDNVRAFLHTREHPFAVFKVNRTPVGSTPSRGTPVRVKVAGTLELNGIIKPAAFNLVVRLDSDQVAAAGSTTVNVTGYGIEVPQGAAGFVSVDPRITLEISLILLKR